MTLYNKYWNPITENMMLSLSIKPQSKTSISGIDNLNNHSGWVQYYAVKQIERNQKSILVDDYKITNFNGDTIHIDNKPAKSNRTTNIMITNSDVVNDSYNQTDSFTKEFNQKKLHNQMQKINSDLVRDLYDIIHENLNSYQAQLCEITGFSKDKLNDNNRVLVTYLDMMVDQGIVESYKEDSHRYYKCIENKKYERVPYIKNLGKSASKLEAKFANFLMENHFEFEQQAIIYNCRYKRPLPFDFCVHNPYDSGCDVYVEINGRQHYEYIPYMHKNWKNFELQMKRDQIKHDYCHNNEIPLIVIDYYQDIETTFKRELKKQLE